METRKPGGGYSNYASLINAVGKASNVNPNVLAAMIVQEQGSKGTSSLISGTVRGYKGYYNFFNVNAYETPSHNKITNGLIYAKNHGWNSVYSSIKGGADFYYRDYVSKKQNTYYLKKFNVNNGLSSVAMPSVHDECAGCGRRRDSGSQSLRQRFKFSGYFRNSSI